MSSLGLLVDRYLSRNMYTKLLDAEPSLMAWLLGVVAKT